MRRWQAIPVAAMVALAVATTLFMQPASTANAGASGQVIVEIDCDPGTAGVQSDCTIPSGPYTLDVVATNDLGFDTGISAVGFRVIGDNQPAFTPNAPACNPPGLDCNPDFNQGAFLGTFQCSPLPIADDDASPTGTLSFLGCFTGLPDSTQFWAQGETIVLGSVSFTAGVGTSAFTLSNVTIDSEFNAELGSCAPEIQSPAVCTGASVAAGGAVGTNTPIPPTNTPTGTATPCSGGSCPTPTSEGFVTVTPTPSATVPGGDTPPPPPPGEGSPVPGEGPGGEGPGGVTGGEGRGPIRLPDTGSGESNGFDALTIALLAMGAGVVAGGVYFGAAAAIARRRNGED